MADRQDSKGTITGQYPALADEIRRLSGGSAARVVARRTGVNFSTITTMGKGDRASFESTLKVALAYRVNPNVLLKISGYAEIPELDLIDWSGAANAVNTVNAVNAATQKASSERKLVLRLGDQVQLQREGGSLLSIDNEMLQRLECEAAIIRQRQDTKRRP